MEQMIARWTNLELRQQVMGALSAAAVLAGVIFIVQIAAKPDMKLLYSNLPAEASGEVIAALDAQGVPYQIRGTSIYVTSMQRDQLRLSLAGQGLPANGGEGYELLDRLTGFGTTSQMFDAAYLRAKEGELARTILANPQIKAARVHIAQANQGPFQRDSSSSASVSIRGIGQKISAETADSIRHLVASAVQGMASADVAIINADLGMVISVENQQTPDRLAQSRAEILKRNVERLIGARVGPGRAVVEVNVETFTENEVLTERLINPDQRVAISSDTREQSSTASGSEGGGVTVASNLPEGDAGAGGAQSSQDSDTREIINYEVSQTTREVQRLPGGIKRVSVAVLLDGTRTDDAFTPRSVEELAVFEDLVKSAVGYDAERGDQVTIRSMDLPVIAPAAIDGSEAGWVTNQPFDIMELAKIGIASATVLAVGIFILKPILLGARSAASETIPSLNAAPDLPALPAPDRSDGQAAEPLAEIAMAGAMGANSPDMAAGNFPNMGGGFDESPVERLKNLIEERQDETVEVLRKWVEGGEGKAT